MTTTNLDQISAEITQLMIETEKNERALQPLVLKSGQRSMKPRRSAFPSPSKARPTKQHGRSYPVNRRCATASTS